MYRQVNQVNQNIGKKTCFTSNSWIARFNPKIDASFEGVGAVLSQKRPNGKIVIAYTSTSLRKSERNMEKLSSIEFELLALKWSVSEINRDYIL